MKVDLFRDSPVTGQDSSLSIRQSGYCGIRGNRSMIEQEHS
jgi:hypothetical protein